MRPPRRSTRRPRSPSGTWTRENFIQKHKQNTIGWDKQHTEQYKRKQNKTKQNKTKQNKTKKEIKKHLFFCYRKN
jgi:hypothetical protein